MVPVPSNSGVVMYMLPPAPPPEFDVPSSPLALRVPSTLSRVVAFKIRIPPPQPPKI